MTHAPEPASSHSPHHLSYATTPWRQPALLQVAGGLGIAGCSIGLLVFLLACFGFGASLYLSPLPLIMGVVGFVLTIVAGLRDPHTEGPSIAAGLFINLAAIVGGVLELAAWLGWRIFA